MAVGSPYLAVRAMGRQFGVADAGDATAGMGRGLHKMASGRRVNLK